MAKAEELGKLEAEMAADAALPLRGANLVFGEGNPEAEVLFVGEAPGYFEDKLKRPFVGRGGQLLDELIKSVGWKRENVYITNIVRRRPPENRDPLPEEIDAYKSYLTRQIEIMNPKLIVALGRFAMNYFLPDAKISRDRGRAFKVEGRLVVPVYHPAAALRSPQMMEDLKKDFKKLPDILAGKSRVEEILAKLPEAKPAKAKKPPQKLF